MTEKRPRTALLWIAIFVAALSKPLSGLATGLDVSVATAVLVLLRYVRLPKDEQVALMSVFSSATGVSSFIQLVSAAWTTLYYVRVIGMRTAVVCYARIIGESTVALLLRLGVSLRAVIRPSRGRHRRVAKHGRHRRAAHNLGAPRWSMASA